MAWEDVEQVFRPKNVHMGVMKIDLEACNKCGLCLKNCPFQVFEADDDGFPPAEGRVRVLQLLQLHGGLLGGRHLHRRGVSRGRRLLRHRSPPPGAQDAPRGPGCRREPGRMERDRAGRVQPTQRPELQGTAGARAPDQAGAGGGPLRPQRRELPALEVHRRHGQGAHRRDGSGHRRWDERNVRHVQERRDGEGPGSHVRGRPESGSLRSPSHPRRLRSHRQEVRTALPERPLP